MLNIAKPESNDITEPASGTEEEIQASVRFHKARIFCMLVVIFQSVCSAIAILFIWYREGTPLPYSYIFGNISIVQQLGLGILGGLTIVVLSIIASYCFEIVRKTEKELHILLGHLKRKHIICVALYSAIGEELLFRGGIQPWLGLLPTSILFGLLHWPPSKTMIFYPFTAALIGMLLGSLFIYTGSLIAPITMHFLINAINLHRINRTR